MDGTTIADLSKAFGSKVDLTRDLRKGDTLSIVYDQTPGAQASDVPTDPLAVRLTTCSESHDVYLHRNLDGKALYYSKDGASTEPAFSRYPLDFTRVSSNFSPNRLNPVTHRWQITTVSIWPRRSARPCTRLRKARFASSAGKPAMAR